MAGHRIKWPLAVTLCAASLWVANAFHPGWQCLASNRCTKVEISGSTLLIDPGTAKDIALLRRLASQHVPDGRSFVATPFWPGAYPLLERRSPMWEIYALFPRSETFEKREIERIKASQPGFALVLDLPLDGREELHFRNTHPLIYRYIVDNFKRLPPEANPSYQSYVEKGLQ